MKRTTRAMVSTLAGVVCAGIFLQAGPAFAFSSMAPAAGAPMAPPAIPEDSLDSPKIRLEVPIFSSKFEETTVALVNGEEVTLSELVKVIISRHQAMTDESTSGKRDYNDALNRIITAKLLVQEAREIGMDKLPAVEEKVDSFRQQALREVLFQGEVKDVKADEKEIVKIHQAASREWKVTPLGFKKLEDAKKFEQELKAGKNFDELAAKAIADGVATRADGESVMKKADTDPRINGPIMKMKPGEVSPAITFGKSGVVFRLDDMRVNDDPELRKQAEVRALSNARLAALKKMQVNLVKKHAKMNQKLFKTLDFEAKKPGFEQMLKDKRVLATVGKEKITVGDLAQGIGEKYFHGVEMAIREKKVNKVKGEVLDDMVSKMVFRKVALEKGLDKDESYLKKVKEYEDAQLFTAFIEKAVKPSIVTKLDDLKAYYNEHIAEFTTPETFVLEEIVFKTAEEAQAAADKLRAKVDFNWLKENSPKVATDLHFEGQVLPLSVMPAGAAKVLTGAAEGDYRIFQSEEGLHYVLHVLKVEPSRQATLDEVSDRVVPEVYRRKITEAIDGWSEKLRAASDVRVFLYKAEKAE